MRARTGTAAAVSLAALLFGGADLVATGEGSDRKDEGERIVEIPSPAASTTLRLYSSFDEGLHASEGAANPFSSKGHVDVVQVGADRGGVARFEGHDNLPDGQSRSAAEKSALSFLGENIPPDRGTLSFRARFSGKRHWADNRRTWLAALIPEVGEYGFAHLLGEEGTGLAVIKDRDNHLVLAVHQFYASHLRPDYRNRSSGREVAPEDEIPVKIPVSDVSKDDWIDIRLAWDQDQGKVWLGIGDRLQAGEVKFRKCSFRLLLLGSPPTIFNSRRITGFDGELDDLLVETRTPETTPNAGLERPRNPPPMARPKPVSAGAVHLEGEDPWLEDLEVKLRMHFARVMQTQRAGGWAENVDFPSMVHFSDARVIVPYGDRVFGNCKSNTSAVIALRLLAAYETLGEKGYLEAVQRTAQTYLKIQHEGGMWPALAVIQGDQVYRPQQRSQVALEDHVQTYPIVLMWRLHELTGRKEYEESAERALAFLLRAQNPNGSWSQSWHIEDGYGFGYGGKYGGEINDFTTSDIMTTMLLAYRRTGNPEYLASYLRAADWIAGAFVDGEHVKGWSNSYDAQDNPVSARDFEPRGISLNEGLTSPPRMLMGAFHLTGSKRYLYPVFKWQAWMERIRQPGGWYSYYDIETGRPIRSYYQEGKRKIVPPDPRSVGDYHMTPVLREIDRLIEPLDSFVSTEESVQEGLEDREERIRIDQYNELFDAVIGSWTYRVDSLHAPVFSPASPRPIPLCRMVFLARQRKGQIPLTHRFSRMTRSDWMDVFNHILPRAELYKSLALGEVQEARALMEP